ncbi:putative outer membrane protein pmp9 [BD1-7 clade bacterium]|uniref:Putative outer membrane protein pmp9 n=1 Tax=BD1-7 clade bacterium TaxID=2029982 RepID=A0A5S9P6P1_9GAMM|nr:putative outer membrane protein pmp9 [BD1-7 clade bacterium]
MKTKIFGSFIVAATMTGCGGGAGGSDDNNKGNSSGDANLAPVVSIFSATKSTLELNESVQLNILAFDPDNDAITCQVDTDGDGTADQSFDDCEQDNSFDISFANAGTYNLSVTASDGELSASKSLTLTVNDVISTPNNNPIITTFSQADSGLVYDGQPFNLNILGSDADSDPLTCTLDTNNDGTADQTIANCETLQTVSVTLNGVGSHTIGLSITDGEFSASKSLTLTVNDVIGTPNNNPVIATFSKAGSGEVYDGQPFNLNISGSDADSDPLTCTLDTNNDGTADQTFANCEANQTVGVTLNGVGSHTIGLSITDGKNTTSDAIIINVLAEPNSNPVITTFSKAGSDEVYDGQPFNLNISGSDADSDPLTCILDTNNDGTADQTITDCETLQTVSVTLNGVKTHAIRLTINDGKGVVSNVITIDVLDANASLPPTIAKFSLASTDTIYAGQTFSVLFRAEDTDSSELTCQLDSDGDGSYDQTISECQNLQVVNLSMASAGDHIIWLKVTDGVTSVTKILTVSAEASTSGSLPEVVSFKLLSPLPIRPNNAVEFEVVGRDTDSDITCYLDGDGDGSNDSWNSCKAEGNILTARFNGVGDYTSILTVTEKSDLKRSTIRALPVTVVSNQSPVLNSVTVSAATSRPNQRVRFTWDATDPEGDALTCYIDQDSDGTQDNLFTDCDEAFAIYSTVGTYTATLKVIDPYAGESAEITVVIDVVDNSAPVIASLGFDKTSVRENETVALTWDVSDADGDQLTCDVDANGDGDYRRDSDGDVTIYNCAGAGSTELNFTAEGELSINMRVLDALPFRAETSSTATLTVKANTAPHIAEFTLDNMPVKVGENASFHIAATDVDADALSCAMDLDADGAFETDIGSCTTPIDFTVAATSTGVFDVALKVTDAYDGETTQVIKVAYYDHEITVDTQEDLIGVDVNNGICTTASGLCSLRAAVMVANHIHTSTGTPSIINLPAGTFTLSLPEPQTDDNALGGDLDVQGNIYVGGVSAETTIIDGNRAVMETRLFEVLSGASVTAFENMTLQNGKDTTSGAFYITKGDLHLLNVKIQNNESNNAVAKIADGRVYVENSSFLNNTSYGYGNLWASDPIFVRNSEFSGNRSGDGGAIYLKDSFNPDGWSLIEATTFDNNASSNNAGAIYHHYGNVEIVDSSFTQNGATDKGGAIYSTAFSTTNIRIENTQFMRNEARNSGGALSLYDGDIVVSNVTFSNNKVPSSTSEGGAIALGNGDLALNNALFVSNSSAYRGGAIMNSSGNIEVSSTVFDSNSAEFGGALYSNVASTNDNVLDITNTLLIRNAASNRGGAIFFKNSDVDEPLTLNYVTFINNSAVGNGGAIYESINSAASVYLKGTILQANTAGIGSNCFGTINSSGYNLIETEESCVVALNPSDSIAAVTLLEDTDAMTGMATATLPPGDSHINSIPAADCTNVNDEAVSTDQLGNVRPQGAGCEPGALEIVE